MTANELLIKVYEIFLQSNGGDKTMAWRSVRNWIEDKKRELGIK